MLASVQICHQSLENDIHRLQEDGLANQDRVDELKSQPNDQKEQVIELTKKLAKSEHSYSTLATEVGQLKEKINDLEQRLPERDAQAHISKEGLAAFEEQVIELAKKLAKLEHRNSTLATEVGKL